MFSKEWAQKMARRETECDAVEARAREIAPMAFNFGDWPIQIERSLEAQREQAREQARAELGA